jgi:hypothetical protein
VIAGGLSGVAAGLVFAAAHALLIVPIWNRMAFGLTSAAAAGLAAGWAFVELGFDPTGADRPPPWRTYAAAGLRFGALLWLAVVPVTLADTALRLAGIAPRFELLAVAIAIGLAVGGGLILGSRFAGTRRAMIAGAAEFRRPVLKSSRTPQQKRRSLGRKTRPSFAEAHDAICTGSAQTAYPVGAAQLH